MEGIVMKKIILAFLCAVCAFTLFSCQKEENTPEEETPVTPEEQVVPEGYTQLTFSAVSDETRTTLDGTTVKWATGDKIKVYCSDASASDFTLVGEGGSSTGDFNGLVPSGKTALYAVYPNDRYYSVSSTTVNVTIPAAQEGAFGKGNIAVAKVDGETHNMAFKNVNALVGFTVPADITKVVVSSVGGQNLCGTLAVDCSGADPAAGALSDGGASITVTFPVSTGGSYYVAIAPGITHSKGLLLTWYKGGDVSGSYWLNKAVTTAANNVYDMETVSADGKYYVTVDGAGKKNGMSWANAWSATQFWSKIHPGGTDSAMDNAKLANISGATFHFAAGIYKWGADAAINISESETISFIVKGGYNASTGARDIASNITTFTGDDNGDGTGDHRILTLGGNMNVTFDGISFVKGKVAGQGAGLMISGGSWSFTDCTFSGNNANNGGAIRFESTGNLALTRTTFDANEASGDGGALSLQHGSITLTNCTLTKNEAGGLGGAIDIFGDAVMTATNSSFSGNEANFGGAIDVESGTQTISGGSFENNTASTNAGAIRVEKNAYLSINGTSFLGNSAQKYGGALDIESSKSSVTNTINNAVFKGNHAQWGGAVEIDGSGSTTKVVFSGCSFGGTESGEPNYVTRIANQDADGGAIHAEGDSYVNIGTSTFTGNTAVNRGGAMAIKGDVMFQLFSDSFDGNHSSTGGVAYTTVASEKYPDLFIDECSFDANYITASYGCVFNIASASHFIMHNSSVRGSYASPSQTGEKGSWIDFDGIQSSTSISNCSIIGDAASSALVWACNGSWTNYFTNNIITSSTSSTESIRSAGSILDLSYNHYYSATSFTDNGGNVSGQLSTNVDGLEWSNTGSSSYYWKWNGTFDSSAPTKTNKTDVTNRVDTASSAFMTWSGSDFNKDQRGTGRGNGDWWPGAYQN